MEQAILAGGCFWGMQDLLRKVHGVSKTTVGYTGGDFPNPTYKDLCTGTTGHAEAVEVLFDPSILSYRKLLLAFFQIHDPTTPNRQGGDRGSQYRSAIFTTSEAQKQTAQQVIQDLTDAKIWSAKIVTEVTNASPFYKAEESHQNYLIKHKGGYTCHFTRPNWTLKE